MHLMDEEEERILAEQAVDMDVAGRMMVSVFQGTERSRLKELTFREESNIKRFRAMVSREKVKKFLCTSAKL
jgi:hypothetical protein